MQGLIRFIWGMIHLFGCPDEDLEPTYKTLTRRCKKCGKQVTVFRRG